MKRNISIIASLQLVLKGTMEEYTQQQQLFVNKSDDGTRLQDVIKASSKMSAISLLFSTPSLPSDDTAAVHVSGSYAPSYSTLSLDIKYSTKTYMYS